MTIASLGLYLGFVPAVEWLNDRLMSGLCLGYVSVMSGLCLGYSRELSRRRCVLNLVRSA